MDGLSRRVDGGRRGQCFAVGVHARLKKTTLNDGGMMYDVGRGQGRRNPGLSSRFTPLRIYIPPKNQEKPNVARTA
jgi:hypothetical protein